MGNLKWYAVRVKKGKGKVEQVKSTIEKLSSMSENKGLLGGVHAPFHPVSAIRNGKKVVEKRYFSFVVLEADMEDARTKKMLLEVPGVAGFVSATKWRSDNEGSPLSEREVAAMLGDDKLAINEMEVGLKKGDEVRVIEGVFRDRIGRIEDLYPSSKKVEVVITMFAKERKVELNFSQIEKK